MIHVGMLGHKEELGGFRKMKFICFIIIGLLFSVSSYSQFLTVLSAEGVDPLLDSYLAGIRTNTCSNMAVV